MRFDRSPRLFRAAALCGLAWALLLACAAPRREANQETVPPAAPLAPAASAGTPATLLPAAKTAAPIFLWKTASPTAVVFLLGSVHVATPDIYPLDERIERAFNDSETLVLELDMAAAAQAEAAQLMLSAALLPQGQRLMEQLDAPTRDVLTKKLARLDVDAARIDRFKPWFVGVTLSMLELEKTGYSHEYGIDKYFHDRAAGKKRLLALETAQQQLAAFQVLENDGDAQSLKLALEVDAADQIGEILQIWQRGDLSALDALLEESRAYPKAFDAMFTARNKRMAEEIRAYLRSQGQYFVVAGAAHLVGKGSVIDVLQTQGHTVTRQ